MNQSFYAAAREFAQALDRDDFSTASTLLAEDCVYKSPGDTLQGRADIMSSYETNSAWASEAFDAVHYSSTVAEHDGQRMCIMFTDRVDHKGVTHAYRCRQILTPNEAGYIQHIDHVEIAGEREALERFLKECGVTRVTPPKPD